MGARSFLMGAAAGAAAVWFLDPDTGAQRRNVAQDKAMSYARKGAAEAESKASYVAGQAAGAVQATKPSSTPPAEERLNDPALARKVESEIFRDEDAPKGAVSVNVEDGVVFLRGEVADDETIRQLAEGAAKVEGVRGVENLLRSPSATS